MIFFVGVVLGIVLVCIMNKISTSAYSRGWKDAFEVTLSLTKSQYIQKHDIEKFVEKQLKE